MTPEEELRKLGKLIQQFEVVYRSSADADQRERVGKELRKLKSYKEKLKKFHRIDENDAGDEGAIDRLDGMPFLRAMAESDRKETAYTDREVYHISLYLRFFEKDFLSILSETRLKLDFKHSLERDSFYHRFESLRRRLEDFEEESARSGAADESQKAEMKQRSFKRQRNLAVEVDRFFRSLRAFAGELIQDLEQDGLKCLNGDDVIQFDRIEGHRYLEGVKVKDALQRLKDLAHEVVQYLNIPQIRVQE